MTMSQPGLTEVKVEGGKKHGNKPRGNRELVYVNSAFVGSVNSVNVGQTLATPEPVTSVYREQYWACSRWPYTQRVLAIAVGILLGALIGLALSMILHDENDNPVLGPLFPTRTIAK